MEQEDEQGERGHIGERLEAEDAGKAAGEPAPRPIDDEQADQDDEGREQDRACDVTERVMAHLMAHDGEHFAVVELGDQGVVEDDSLGTPGTL